jgi:GT2 family glycosyltransferase
MNWLRKEAASPDDFVLIMNDDTNVEPAFIESGVKALRDRKRTLLLAQLYDRDSGQLVECGAHIDWRTLAMRGTRDASEVNCFSTRGLFLRVCDMLEIGRFHPVLLPHYTSDYEYTMRAARMGFSLLTVPEVRLWYDKRTTGVRKIESRGLMPFLRVILSKRAADNPLYFTSFIVLACPLRYVPLNIFRAWRNFLLRAMRAALV